MDLFQLAHRMKSTAWSLSNMQGLFEDKEIIDLGEKLTQAVKERHGDESKISPSLLDSYEESKIRRGGPANSPLLWDGTKRDSYEFMITPDPSGDGTALVIGSNENTALWHEMGYFSPEAGPVPARPVLLPTVFEHEAEVVAAFGEAMISLFFKEGGSNSISTINYLK